MLHIQFGATVTLYSPVPSRLALKEVVKSAHLVGRDSETGQVAVHHANFLDQSVQRSFGFLADFVRGAPEDDHRVVICPL